MTIQMSGCSRAAAERFARFQERSDVKRTVAKYADFVATPDGLIIAMRLSFEAISYLSGITTRHEYEAAVDDLAKRWSIPVVDLRALGECSAEVLKAVGLQRPISPGA